MDKLFIEDLPIKGKKVLMRVDFNVPLDGNLMITDPTRIIASLDSIRYVLNQGAALILMSHLGRPKNEPNPDFSLKPCANMLSQILKQEVVMAPDCVGSKVEDLAQKLQVGQVLMLENLRFHRAEEYPDEDPSFAQKLANLADFYVDDAFGAAHRKHSSTYAIVKYFLPNRAAAGYLVRKEVQYLFNAMRDPQRPFYALIGGAKISSKMGVIKSLLQKVDAMLVGGGMAYTFLKAQGIPIGKSLCEEEFVPAAKEIIEECRKRNIPLLLPLDFKAATEESEDAKVQIVETSQGFPENLEGLDIGPKTIKAFGDQLKKAKTIFWNGPLGIFELEPFADGTNQIAKIIGSIDAVSIVGGGDSIAAINAAGLADTISHLSTGGGAALEFIENGTLPGIDVLPDRTVAHTNAK